MPENVTSEFKSLYWVKMTIWAGFYLLVLIWLIQVSINKSPDVNDRYYTIALFLVCTAWGVYLIMSTRRILVAKEGIIITYIITKRERMINYADIKHVENVGVTDTYKSTIKFNYRKLEIELVDGSTIIFDENQYANYDDLKETIRRFRFGLE